MEQPSYGTPAPTVYMVVDNDQKETSFAKKPATILSITQIVLGLASFLAQIVIIILHSTNHVNWHDYVAGIGEGIYCGFFFIIAGGLGLLASRRPTTCCISAFMILSIIASIFGGIEIINSSINLTFVTHDHARYSRYSGSYYGSIAKQEAKIGMFSIMIVCGLVEMVVAIICSALCCRACCCAGMGDNTERVVYLAQGEHASGATPVQIAGGAPVQMPAGVPVHVAGGIPVQIPGGVAQIGLKYGDVMKGETEEIKQKDESGGYNRLVSIEI